MSERSFSLKFDGPAFADHEIDVNDLAPALLALGAIVREANRAINGDRAQASLKLRATAEGSFDALLMIDVAWLQSTLEMFGRHKDEIATAKDLSDLLLNGIGIVGPLGVGFSRCVSSSRDAVLRRSLIMAMAQRPS